MPLLTLCFKLHKSPFFKQMYFLYSKIRNLAANKEYQHFNYSTFFFSTTKTRFTLFVLLIRGFFCHSTKILNKHQILMYCIFKHKKERIRRAKAIRNLTLMIRALDFLPRLPRFKTTGWLQGWLYLSFFWGRSNEHQELQRT